MRSGGFGEVKVLTSCPSCLQGLKRYNDDAGLDADYIVVEIARHVLGADWLRDYVAAGQCRGHRARAGLRSSRGERPPQSQQPQPGQREQIHRAASAGILDLMDRQCRRGGRRVPGLHSCRTANT